MLGSRDTAETQRRNALMQRKHGASIDILTPDETTKLYPWLNLDYIGITTYGNTNEGWFDACALLQLVRREAKKLGAKHVKGEAVAIDCTENQVTGVRLANGTTIPCDWCVNAAGPAGGQVADRLNIKIPGEPRKRTVFHFEAPVSGANFPMLFDDSGLWIRPVGEGFIAGIAPDEDRDPHPGNDFEPAHYQFEEIGRAHV